jgi:superfamily I DNA/RNA helicase
LLLNRPNRYLRNEVVDQIAAHLRPWDALTPEHGDTVAPRAVVDLVQRVLVLHHRLQGCTAAQLLDTVITEFQLERYWTDEFHAAASQQQDDAGPMQVVAVLRSLATDQPTVEAFLRRWDEQRATEEEQADTADDDLAREESADTDRVVIGTIHSSKGREYASVVIVDYAPDLSRMSDLEREEERRVLYVGVTRAKDAVLLTVDRSRQRVHPFVAELIAPAGGAMTRARSRLNSDGYAAWRSTSKPSFSERGTRSRPSHLARRWSVHGQH